VCFLFLRKIKKKIREYACAHSFVIVFCTEGKTCQARYSISLLHSVSVVNCCAKYTLCSVCHFLKKVIERKNFFLPFVARVSLVSISSRSRDQSLKTISLFRKKGHRGTCASLENVKRYHVTKSSSRECYVNGLLYAYLYYGNIQCSFNEILASCREREREREETD